MRERSSGLYLSFRIELSSNPIYGTFAGSTRDIDLRTRYVSRREPPL